MFLELFELDQNTILKVVKTASKSLSVGPVAKGLKVSDSGSLEILKNAIF